MGTEYTAGDVVQVKDGFSIAFAAGVMDSSETFTVAVTAAHRLRSDHRQITADAVPVAISPTEQTSSVDEITRTRNNDIYRNIRAISRNPTIQLDYLTDTERMEFGLMHHARHELTLFENYDQNTVLLWRGSSGTMPLIGEEITFTRSGNATYQDPATGLWKAVDTDEARYATGKMDKAIFLNQANVSNILPRFHATSANVAWAGTGLESFDTDVKPPLDPDEDYWNVEVLKGTQRIELDDAEQSSSVTDGDCSSSTEYTGHVLLRGVGKVDLNLMSGVGSANVVTATTVVTLDTNTWTQYSVTGTTGGSDAKIALQLLANGNGQVVCWVSAAQIEAGAFATPYIQTLGSPPGTINADDIIFNLELPLPGTISFWWYYPEDTPVGYNYRLFEGTSAATFSIRYNEATDVVQFFTHSTGGQQLASGTAGFTRGNWYHIAVTYGHSSTVDGELDREIFINGVSSSSDSNSAWAKTWGNQFEFSKTGATSGIGIRFQELRIDEGVLSAATILRIYNRFVETEWRQAHIAYAGRRYQITGTSEDWLDVANPDKFRITARLAQSSIDPDAVVLSR
jgi:hypothetical protein